MTHRFQWLNASFAAVAVALAATAAPAAPITAPYFNTFDTVGDDGNFTLNSTTDTSWALNTASGGSLDVSFQKPGSTPEVGSAFTEVTNLGGSSTLDFTITANFSVNVDSDFTNFTQFYFLTDFDSFTGTFGGSDNGYRVIVRGNDLGTAQFFINEVVDGETTTQANKIKGGTFDLNDPSAVQNLVIDGEYQTNGDLKITATLTPDFGSGPASPVTIEWTDTTPLTGQNFGFGNQSGGNPAGTVLFRDYEINAIPEPASLAMGLVGLTLLATRRGRPA